MLFSLGHGQHVAVTSEANAPAQRERRAGADASPQPEPIAKVAPGVARLAAPAREFVGAGADEERPEPAADAAELDGTFCYYFETASSLPNRPDMPALLDQLAETMVTDTDVPPESNNSQIPAIFTYLGQFIDHDITANTDRDTEISEIGDTTFPRRRAPRSTPSLATCATARWGSIASTATTRQRRRSSKS